MPKLTTGIEPISGDEEISLLALGSSLLRRRWMISVLIASGILIGLAYGLLSTRVYRSSAVFIPQSSEGGATGLAMAASEFGIRLPATSGSSWGPAVYVGLLESRALLEPIARDTVVVSEDGSQRIAVVDLLDTQAPNAERRIELAVRRLRGMVSASEVKTLGGIQVSVTTKWPSVSLAIAQRLVRGVNEFNLRKTRKLQATAERQFAETQASDAEGLLRAAEDRLQSFLQANRITIGSPQLSFERDRLQRGVLLRQQLYSALLQNREEARLREVRDTPVIVILEEPQLPLVGESRKVAQKTLIGALFGGFVGALIVFLSGWWATLRGTSNKEAREFIRLLQDATPRSLWRLGNKGHDEFRGEE